MSPIRSVLEDLAAGDTIDPIRIEACIHTIMLGEHDEAQTAALLTALAARPIDAATLAAAARALRGHCRTIRPRVRPLVDTCGTGGDGARTFNVSTAVAMVLAAAGAAVAKHGNRAVTSKVGSADVLEAAGCDLELGPDACRRLLDATGFAFLFAPAFHPAMRHVAPVRRRLGIRTIFNLLGPLANPAHAEFQLLGVYAPELTGVVADALRRLGSRGALVVHCAGLDEIGLHDVTRGHRLRDDVVEPIAIDPEDFGLARRGIDALRGGDRDDNLRCLRAALRGDGACGDVVALNAAAALELVGLVGSIDEGLERARACQANGAALRVLTRYAESTRRMTSVVSGSAAARGA